MNRRGTIDDRKLNKSQKLVRIIEALQAPGGISSEELRTRFDLDDRTMRRYLADLRGLELPLKSEGRGDDRRLWLDASYRRIGVQLSMLEMVSLRFGRSLFNFLEGTGFAADMDEALDSLSTLGVGSADIVRNLDRKLIAIPEHRKDHTRDADVIDDVLSALLYQNPVVGHYARPSGPTRRYMLHPYTLATYRQSLYLFALDVEQGKVKTFAIDRFRNFERQRGEHFEYPADYDPSDLYKDAFGIMSSLEVVKVVLRFNRRASPYVKERIWHPGQKVEAFDDGSVLLSMDVSIGPELVSWILGFGPDVRVEGPIELVERVRRLHREAADGWQDAGSEGAGHRQSGRGA